MVKGFLGFTCCPDKWFSSSHSKESVVDGLLPWAGWSPQPASRTTFGFSLSTNVSPVSHRTINFLNVTIDWFLASAFPPCKDPSDLPSEQYPLKYPLSATCLKNPKSLELSSGLNSLNRCSWKGWRVIFWQQPSLERHASKQSQAS